MSSDSSSSDLCVYMLAILLPPLAVGLKCGCGMDLLLNNVLTLLAWFPGVVHAFYAISKKNEELQARKAYLYTKEPISPPPMDYQPVGSQAPQYPPPQYPPQQA